MCRATETLVANKVLERDVLPANVIPRHYQLELEPDFDKFTFNGKVVIDLDIAEDSSSITLHSLEIDIRAVKIASGGTEIRWVAPLLTATVSAGCIGHFTAFKKTRTFTCINHASELLTD